LDMDAYFAEGEARSRELEGGGGYSKPSAAAAAAAPPAAGSVSLPPPPPPPPPPAARGSVTGDATIGTGDAVSSTTTTSTATAPKKPLPPPPKAGTLPKFGNVEWLGESATGVMSVNPSPGLLPLRSSVEKERRDGVGMGSDGTADGGADDEEEEHIMLPERLNWEDDDDNDGVIEEKGE